MAEPICGLWKSDKARTVAAETMRFAAAVGRLADELMPPKQSGLRVWTETVYGPEGQAAMGQFLTGDLVDRLEAEYRLADLKQRNSYRVLTDEAWDEQRLELQRQLNETERVFLRFAMQCLEVES